MHDMPEYSVGCTYPNGRQAGRCFDTFDEADAYYVACVASGRYANVAMYDAVDNCLNEWMCDLDAAEDEHFACCDERERRFMGDY